MYPNFNLFTHFKVSFFNRNIKGTMGIILPRTQIGRTVVIGNPIKSPTGTAPLSSITGIAEIIAKIPRSGIPKVLK